MRQLTSLDAYFLAAEHRRAPQHVSALVVLDPADLPGKTVSLDALGALISDRLHLVPQFRWRLAEVPLGLDHGYWFDDPDFDLDFHLREIALPVPGSDEQLKDQVARIFARPLDRAKPLWEMYLIHGLAGGRVAMLTKIHHALVDGVSGAEVLGTLLDLTPEPRSVEPPRERPVAEAPSELDMLARGLAGVPRRMGRTLSRVPGMLGGLGHLPVVGDLLGVQALSGFAARLRGGARPKVQRPTTGSVPRTSFNAPISAHRRLGLAVLPLDEVNWVKKAYGVTVNDVVMAVCAGATRRWLIEHGELPAEPLVSLVPMSVRTGDQTGSGGNKVSGVVVPIPTDEGDPTARLMRASAAMHAAKEYSKAVPADILSDVTQFVPPALLGLAARTAVAVTALPWVAPLANTNISNVPGPQLPLYCAGARVAAMYPLAGLVDGVGMSTTVMSYNGRIYAGITADRELVPDVQRVADWMAEELAELAAEARMAAS